MAIPKKGSRKIVVDGIEYRWYIRRNLYDGVLTVAVELAANASASILYVVGLTQLKYFLPLALRERGLGGEGNCVTSTLCLFQFSLDVDDLQRLQCACLFM